MSHNHSLFYSILSARCPRCREGKLFAPDTLYRPSKFSKMNKDCPCCGQAFELEPGFYFGAMFVSYGFNTAIFVAVWIVLSNLVEEVTLTMMIVAILVIVIGLLPVIFRLSRSIWIHIFVRYEGPCQDISRHRH